MKNPSQNKLRAAIIGASGIGKNHARWFHQHGCEVSAFVGSSRGNLERTRETLRAGFGFDGRGYDDVKAMLESEKPDIVCVSSPPPLHFSQTLECLRAGAHVLCEKPLVYDPQISIEQLRAQADELVATADNAGVLLGTQMQYGAVASQLLQAAKIDASKVRRFEMVMETKNVKENRSHEQIWVDLAPHPLSVLQKIAPRAVLETDSIECRVDERETHARFRLRRAPDENEMIECEITVRFDPDANPPQRYFVFNERKLHYAGRNNAAGEFRSFLGTPERETELPDFVDLTIGNFVAACRGEAELLVSGRDGAQNIHWVLQILARG